MFTSKVFITLELWDAFGGDFAVRITNKGFKTDESYKVLISNNLVQIREVFALLVLNSLVAN